MKTIVLFGHEHQVQTVFTHVDELLRQRGIEDVVLVQTSQIDQATERALRIAGGELWYCGPTLSPPGGGWSPVHADRYLLSACWGALAGKAMAALNEFTGNARGAAA